MKKKQTINCSGNLLTISKPIVMGILNATPDSFYDGGRNNSISSALKKANEIISDGAKIIDIGSFSTRPNGELISEKEEAERLFPILKAIKKEFPNQIVSVDTFRSEIAQRSVEQFGADVINDISAGTFDVQMFSVIAKLNVPYVMMHLQGNIQNMHTQNSYIDMMQEIILFFAEKINILKSNGVKDIIIDPGFGFSKDLQQNYVLLQQLKKFSLFDELLLVGLSRKSMIYKKLDILPEESLNGTSVLNTIALLSGANILRVHDVKEAVEAIELVELSTSVIL